MDEAAVGYPLRVPAGGGKPLPYRRVPKSGLMADEAAVGYPLRVPAGGGKPLPYKRVPKSGLMADEAACRGGPCGRPRGELVVDEEVLNRRHDSDLLEVR
jgi:hypothetical protein